jgi:hypothetical protein
MKLAGCRQIEGNRIAPQLARARFGHPLTGPERARGNSEEDAKQFIMVWMKRNHQKH